MFTLWHVADLNISIPVSEKRCFAATSLIHLWDIFLIFGVITSVNSKRLPLFSIFISQHSMLSLGFHPVQQRCLNIVVSTTKKCKRGFCLLICEILMNAKRTRGRKSHFLWWHFWPGLTFFFSSIIRCWATELDLNVILITSNSGVQS